MTDLNPPGKSVSLDDLLKANRDQFDKIFATQMREIGLVGARHRPPTQEDLASASLQIRREAEVGDVTTQLNRYTEPAEEEIGQAPWAAAWGTGSQRRRQRDRRRVDGRRPMSGNPSRPTAA